MKTKNFKPATWAKFWKFVYGIPFIGPQLVAWGICEGTAVGAYGGRYSRMSCVYPRRHVRATCLSDVDHRGHACPEGHRFFADWR